MKKNVLILMGLCLLGLFTWQVQAANKEHITPINNELEDNVVPHGYDKIVLQGTLMYGINPNAIVAGANDNSVYIGFNEEFGNVNISIHSITGGLVYYTVVNTNVQSVVIIPFGGVASGLYPVELSSANGYVDGYFEHE